MEKLLEEYLKNMDSYLQKPLIRGLILLPPIIMCIGILVGIYCKILTHPFVLPFYIFSFVYLMIGLIIILWSDCENIE